MASSRREPGSHGIGARRPGNQTTWHDRTASEVAELLKTQSELGLTAAEAERRLVLGGSNELPEQPGPGLLALVWAQLSDFLVLLLFAAAGVSLFLGEYVDAAAVAAILILNAFLGVSQELRAERSLEALRKLSAPFAKVIRAGQVERIPTRELVQGDLVVLEAGDFVPADLRLVTSHNLRIDESALTGESVPVDKEAGAVFSQRATLGDRRNTGFSGTVVSYGRGRGIVVATGPHTELGLIAGMLQGIETEPTPLQRALGALGRAIGLVTLVICAIVFVTGLQRGGEVMELFMTAVSLAVAAVPEGLPAVVTIVLALGTQRMVARHVVIRRLPAVETLGATTVICTDKTGTLTQNQMTVTRIWADGRTYDVSGEGYRPMGDFSQRGRGHVEVPLDDGVLRRCLQIGVLCNDAELQRSGETGGQATWRLVGDPTEGALIAVGHKAGLPKPEEEKTWPRVAEVPFDSARKRMSTVHCGPGGEVLALVKGAPDILLRYCSKQLTVRGEIALSQEARSQILEANHEIADQALRVLGLAYRRMREVPRRVDPATVESELIFAGLAGMIDPVRPEAVAAIETCRRAGIIPIMVTGDYRDTAIAVGRALGLDTSPEAVVAGDELEQMSQVELVRRARTVSIYARVAPDHKVRIVDALKKDGRHVVAMTGDGVNDAMALKRADIGVSMGITGTDVAKETADMILTDDNFASIVSAVEEGRTIFANIRKFVFFLLSCNVGEVLIVFGAMLAGLPLPLRPIHLLWLNLVTDSLPALALGLEPPERDTMSRPPRNPREGIISRPMVAQIGVQAVVEAAATLGAFVWAWATTHNLVYSQTMAFATLVTAELVRAHTSRSDRYTVRQLGLWTNRHVVMATLVSFAMLLAVLYIPVLATAFRIVALSGRDWIIAGGLALLPALTAEALKTMARRRPAA
ncbi:MAG: cation-translocating P-type ATPase [Bacillota bacterium]|nr:cation-translocating P-type ATPase [Bacillota bacterium]